MRKITPDEDEVRITDAYSGGQKGSKLARYDLIPVAPLEELAKLYGAGARKYDDRNWEKGYAWSLSYAAFQRHANAFWAGESIDAETQRHHLAAAMFHAMALMEMQYRGTGTDDRPPSVEETDDEAWARYYPSGGVEEVRRSYGEPEEAPQEAWDDYYHGGERPHLEKTDLGNAHAGYLLERSSWWKDGKK